MTLFLHQVMSGKGVGTMRLEAATDSEANANSEEETCSPLAADLTSKDIDNLKETIAQLQQDLAQQQELTKACKEQGGLGSHEYASISTLGECPHSIHEVSVISAYSDWIIRIQSDLNKQFHIHPK